MPIPQTEPGVTSVMVGMAVTVTILLTVVTQPAKLVTAYNIVSMPPLIALTKPVLLTVAIAVLVDDQTPEAVASLSCVVLPTQTEAVPVMAATLLLA